MVEKGPINYPKPPELHWAGLTIILFVLAAVDGQLQRRSPSMWVFSVGFFGIALVAWEIRQAVFVRSIDRGSRGLWMTIVGGSFFLLGRATAALWVPNSPSWMLTLLGFVFVLGAQFDMRRSLEGHYNSVEPIGVKINSGLLLFLGVFYLQYHFRKIALAKQSLR